MSLQTTHPERWRRLEAIFEEVSAIPVAEQTGRLATLCAGDGELLADAQSLLRAAVEEKRITDSFVPRKGQVAEAGDTHIGRRVGPYELERLLGRGGMGAVYLARRVDGQFEQQVAVKLIDVPLVGSVFRERFRQERQILAGLSHPFIARLLDGGVGEEGEPYLAMEYADGLPIQKYCETHSLGLRARIELFRKVCTAVRFAHQNMVIHRDLKPDNILVLEDGTPKLLDFGTAKLVTPDERGAESDFTRQGFHSFTPQYASPEQVLGQPISTASDTYSLGVLLFLLMTGEMPYELKEFSTVEMVRVICEQPAPKPSERAARGGIDSDIDAIVSKALRKEPEARYASVEQLIADLDAYGSGRPVAAHQGSFRYRARKFARRNRLPVAAASLLAATLVAGIVGVIWQARIANIERRKAEAQVEDLRKLSNSLLTEIDGAIQKIPGSTEAQRLLVGVVLEHLDRAAKDAAGDPQLALDLANAYTESSRVQGNPYMQNIGDVPGALASADKAIAIATAVARQQPSNPAAARTLGLAQEARSEVLFGVGRIQESVAAMRAAAATLDQLASRPRAETGILREAASAYGSLGDELGQSGSASLGDPVAAVAAYHKALALEDRIVRLRPNYPIALRAIAIGHMKIASITAETDPAAALPDYGEAVDAMKALSSGLGQTLLNGRPLAIILMKQGSALMEIGRYREALSDMAQARALLRPTLAADPNDTRARYDMVAALDNEAQCYEERAEGVFAGEAPDRTADAAAAAKILVEERAAIESLLRHEPDNINLRSDLGSVLIRLSRQLLAIHRTEGTRELAARGVSIVRAVAKQPNARDVQMDEAARGLIAVLPESLRDPQLAVKCAEGAVEMRHRRRSDYLLTLARAYRSAGQADKARASAKEGLSLLPAATAATVASRVQKLLQAEAVK